MDLNQRTAVAEKVKRMRAEGVQLADVIAYLKSVGCDSREAVAVLAVVYEMRMSEAKSVIFQSPAWSQERDAVADLHDQLEDS
jgi:hypothetical protein